MRRESVYRVAIVGGLLALGAAAWGVLRFKNYVDNDPGLCAQCHRASPEFALWNKGSHRGVACQRCHHTTAEEGLAMLRAFLAGASLADRKPHARVEVGACAACHLSHDPQYLPAMLAALDDNDLVIGSRYLRGVSVANWPLRRLVLSVFANRYVRFVTGLSAQDCTSGYRCWRREALARLPGRQRLDQNWLLVFRERLVPRCGEGIIQFLSKSLVARASGSQVEAEQLFHRLPDIQEDPDVAFWFCQGKAGFEQLQGFIYLFQTCQCAGHQEINFELAVELFLNPGRSSRRVKLPQRYPVFFSRSSMPPDEWIRWVIDHSER